MSLRGALAATLLGLAATAAQAWSQHAAMAYRAFEVMPEVARAAPVTAEPLEAFLRAQPAAIAQAVEAQEAWARAHVKHYPARPDALRWQWAAGQADADLRKGFLAAMRLSPQSRFALFVQLDPWAAAATEPSLDWAQAASVPPSKGAVHRLRALHPGEPVPALAVLASACDEPDYGLDLQLFDDNPGSPSGYGFGKQPFGNPAVAIGSQAPFHMGFLHQGRVFDTLAPSLTRSLVELRVAQFSALARLAFGTGHAYWGWRFAGLAAHYVQDLTQPYHASAAPGESLPGMLWANTAAALGMPAAKQALVILQGNRHFALEQLQARWILDNAERRRESDAERALHDTGLDARYPAWTALSPREVVAAEAYAAGPQTDAAVVTGLPARYVNDPGYDFAASGAQMELGPELAQELAAQRRALQTMVSRLLGRFGAHSRNLVRALRAGSER